MSQANRSAAVRRLASAVFAAAVLGALVLPGVALAGADNFANAPLYPVATVNDTGSNAAATVETGEPRGPGWPNGPTKTHWVTWQAPQAGSATVTTCGSNFDTMLAVWTGRAVTTLQAVAGASNDDNPTACGASSLQSAVTFNAVGGQRYRIQVDGFNGASGTYQVHITQTAAPVRPQNDDLAASSPISGGTVAIDGGNVGATKETGEADHAGFPAATTSVWYSWTAPSAGTVTIDTCGSGIDTVLGVYRGNAFPLTTVVANDDAVGGICASSSTHSRVVFSTAAGVTHRIAVAGYNGATGYFTLNLAVTADTTAPDTTLGSGGPSGTTNSPNPSFDFSTNEPGAGFECKLDGPGATTGTYSSCSAPKAYSALADGAYTFSVRAVDGSGNTDDTPATRSFTVDTTGPETAIDSGPSGPTASTDASFQFSSPEDGATFECKLDGPGDATGSFDTCPSPRDYTSLAEGAYTFSVRALDGLGNPDASPATHSFTVDTTAPDTTIGSGPSGTVTDRTAKFAFFSADTSATFECKLDGPGGAGTYGPCVSPKEYSSLADGAYTFSARAVDPAGNPDPSAATWQFTAAAAPGPPGGGNGLDTTPPTGLASIPKQKLGSVLKSGKLVENVTTNEAATLAAQAVLDGKLAKKLGLPPNGTIFAAAAKPAIVATGRAQAAAAGKVKVTLKLTKKARKKLRKQRKLTLTLRTRLTDAAGNSAVVVKKVTLKR
jgi:hypothetical protein